jgi:hypothetical protein
VGARRPLQRDRAHQFSAYKISDARHNSSGCVVRQTEEKNT